MRGRSQRVQQRHDVQHFGRLREVGFLGLLREKRTKDVERLIEREIAKDVAQLDPAAIAAQIWG